MDPHSYTHTHNFTVQCMHTVNCLVISKSAEVVDLLKNDGYILMRTFCADAHTQCMCVVYAHCNMRAHTNNDRCNNITAKFQLNPSIKQ